MSVNPVRPGDGGGHPKGDALRAAYERMDAATVEQLREVLRCHALGINCGVYSAAIAPFRTLRGQHE